MKRKGIILAGGSGTRLYPVTHVTSKQLLPVYDKPMIYYPLTTLMLAGIREILIISTPHDLPMFESLAGRRISVGCNLSYEEQPSPDGLAQALIIGETFIGDDLATLILGDNIFYGHDMHSLLNSAHEREQGATVFVYHVMTQSVMGSLNLTKTTRLLRLKRSPTIPNLTSPSPVYTFMTIRPLSSLRSWSLQKGESLK